MIEFLFRQPTALWVQVPQSAQSMANPMPPQDVLGPRPDRIAELEQRAALLEAMLDAMTAQRDHALLRMEAAIATSNGLIDAEVRRRAAEAGQAPAFPASALRQQRQAIGLLSTADAGRVRLGGYAPSLPTRTRLR